MIYVPDSLTFSAFGISLVTLIYSSPFQGDDSCGEGEEWLKIYQDEWKFAIVKNNKILREVFIREMEGE